MTGPSPVSSPRKRGEGRAPSAAGFVAAVVRPEIRALSAYAVARAEGMIKLDAMENPYPLPAGVRTRLSEALARVPINRYPDGGAHAAKGALRRVFSIPVDQDLLLANGSDELIQIITSALACPGAAMLVPEPSFVMYRMNALYAGMRFIGVPLRGDFRLDRAAMLAAIERERPSLVYLAYPNNPTGNLFAAIDVEAVLRAAPGLVVIDEAYYAFADASFLPRVAEFANLLVLRTVSKVGMAGIRLGYAVAAPEWIAELNKVRQPYNVNALTQAAAEALLTDTGWIAEQAAAIRTGRARLETELKRLPGTTVFPTQTNFVLVRVTDANEMFEGLKARCILVKNLHGWHPLLANCLRITVGTTEENDLLLAALNELNR
jgi:histidinol-phosphate aminotransferase